ncbi:MAG: phosphate ABC transporter permease [Microcoleaceae cyanobacterium]
MLIPITRTTFEELIPAVATAEQFKHCWGKLDQFLKRLLISAAIALVLVLLEVSISGDALKLIFLLIGIIAGLYWFWGPILEASLKNLQCRKHPYCGFWQGKILDIYITEAVTSEQESVNKRGELIIIENLERRINVEVGDSNGFTACIQAPLTRNHKKVSRGQTAQMIIMSYLDDLSRISQVSDIYIPSQNLWVSDYPYLRRDTFIDVSRKMRARSRQQRMSRENQQMMD